MLKKTRRKKMKEDERATKKYVEKKQIPPESEEKIQSESEEIHPVEEEIQPEGEIWADEQEEILLAEKEEIPLAEQEEIPLAEEEEIPLAEQEEISLTEQEEVPLAEQEEVPLAEQEEVSLAEQEEVPLAEQEEVPLAEQEEIPLEEQEEVPLAEQEEVPLAEQEEVPLAEQEETESAEQEDETESSELQEKESAEQEEEKELVEQEEIQLSEQEEIQSVELEEVPLEEQEPSQLAKEDAISSSEGLIIITPTQSSLWSTRLHDVFIEFQETRWFQYIFSEGIPKFLTMREFISCLLSWLNIVSFDLKIEIISAILQLHEQEDLEDIIEVQDVLLTLLNESDTIALQEQEQEQQELFLVCLHAMTILCSRSIQLFQGLMMQFLHASARLRKHFKNLFEILGIHDPKGYFYKEMDTWPETRVTKTGQQKLCYNWLQECIQQFKDHEAEIQCQVLKGKKGKMAKKSIVKGLDLSHISVEDAVRAINYFCEQQLEKEQKIPKRKIVWTTMTASLSPKKREAVHRLGETNSMLRTRTMEHFYLPPVPRKKPLTFGPFINLPLKKIDLNPFPSLQATRIPPSLLTCLRQASQKYFILERSYPESFM